MINAFGYESSQMGMMAYRQTMARLMQESSPSDLETIQSVRLLPAFTCICEECFGYSVLRIVKFDAFFKCVRICLLAAG